MAHRTDVARGRDIVARWSALAEQRLDYLTELFETGRWRRFHSEHEFLENIREAKTVVEYWRNLLSTEATTDNRPVDLSWMGRRAVPLALRDLPATPVPSIAPQLAVAPEPLLVSMAPDVPDTVPDAVVASVLETVETPVEGALDETLALTLDIVAMAERYPLLRNAFQQPGQS